MNEIYIKGLFGGMLIGLAAVLLYGFNGKVMGVSGILSRLLQKPDSGFAWRLSFVMGILLAGLVYRSALQVQLSLQLPLIILAGLLVGFGTVLGNGCTSGHGICGNARLSPRSMVATMIFMLTGILTVLLKKKLGF